MGGEDYHEYEAGRFAYKVHDVFSGEVYENEHTMTTDAAYRFETTETKLRGAMILVSTHDALIGDSTAGYAYIVVEYMSVTYES